MWARRLAIVVIAVATVGCTSASPRYRTATSLKSVVVGEPKATVLAAFGPRDMDDGQQPIKVERMRIRATQRTPGGELLEIGEVPLVDPASGSIRYYWFLFKNERLAMWGRAEDWRRVSAQFPITFEPRAAPAPAK